MPVRHDSYQREQVYHYVRHFCLFIRKNAEVDCHPSPASLTSNKLVQPLTDSNKTSYVSQAS